MSTSNNSNNDKNGHNNGIFVRLWRYFTNKLGKEEASSIENKSEMQYGDSLFPPQFNPVQIKHDVNPKIKICPNNLTHLSQAKLAKELKDIHRSLKWIKLFLLIIVCSIVYPYFSSFLSFLQYRTTTFFSAKNVTTPDLSVNQIKASSQNKVSAGTLYVNKSEEGIDYEALIVDISNLNLFLTDDTGKPLGDFQNLKNFLYKNKQKLVFAMNAGIYGQNIQPLGLHVANGKLIRKLNLLKVEKINGRREISGNFFMFPNGVFLIRDGEASIVESNLLKNIVDWKNTKLATQSGPLLLINNELHPKFNQESPNQKIRNGVGIIDKNKVVFIITKNPITFYDFAIIFKNEFKCKDALYLDGVISKMYVSEINGDNFENDSFAGMFAISTPLEPDN